MFCLGSLESMYKLLYCPVPKREWYPRSSGLYFFFMVIEVDVKIVWGIRYSLPKLLFPIPLLVLLLGSHH